MSNRYCSVPRGSSKAHRGISMHYFPKEKSIKKEEWSRVLRIAKPISKYMIVCGLHFTKEDYFYPDVRACKSYLKKGAIPSQKLPLRSLDKKISSPLKLQAEARDARVQHRHEAVAPPSPTEDSEVVTEDTETVAEEMFAALVEDPTLRKCVEGKGIQVTPSVIDDCRKITLEDMMKTNREINAFTGIPSVTLLDNICVATGKLERQSAKPLTLSLRQRIILVFVKLKINLYFRCLAVLFGVTANTCTNYFHVTVDLLHEALKSAVPWLEKDLIKKRMPICFQHFQNTRVILDCTEIPVEKNKCLKYRVMSYSHYKGEYTLKVLVGVAPSGLVTFVSQVYGGRVTDKEIFLQSNLLGMLLPYQDAVMVDKRFLIESECIERNIQLIRPPFLGKNEQLSTEDELRTADIAAARVHVERTIQRMKIFKVLKGRVNLYMVRYMDSVMTIIAGVVNLSAPILSVDKYD